MVILIRTGISIEKYDKYVNSLLEKYNMLLIHNTYRRIYKFPFRSNSNIEKVWQLVVAFNWPCHVFKLILSRNKQKKSITRYYVNSYIYT